MAHSVKKWQMFEQFRGRVMRCAAPVVIWLQDGNRMGKRHFKELEGWIQQTNGEVIPFEYRQGAVHLPAMPVPPKSKLVIDEPTSKDQASGLGNAPPQRIRHCLNLMIFQVSRSS
jgi:hypothetical protein